VVLDEEGAGRAVDVDPAGQVAAVEHRREAVVLGRGRGQRRAEQEQAEQGEASHGWGPRCGVVGPQSLVLLPATLSSMTARAPLIVLQFATVSRPGGPPLRDLTWALYEGETWAVVGPVGSGKTTLAEALLGRLPLAAGTIDWPIGRRSRGAAW